MTGSFLDTLKDKPVAEQPTAQESTEATATQEVAAAELAEGEQASEEQEQEVTEVSDKVRKELSNKGSFLDKIKEAKELEEAQKTEELALEEQELQEAEEEAAAQEVETPAPVTFKVDDQEFDTPEAVNEYVTTLKAERAELQAEVDEIRGFVEKISDPDTLEILKYVNMGYPLRVAMVKAGFDETMFNIQEGDPDAKELVRAQIDREEAVKAQEKEQKKLQKNMEQSNVNLTEFATQKGFDEAKKTSLVNQMAKIHQELLNGLVTKETLEIFSKGLNYETAVKQAAEVAAIQAKNEKIVVERQKSEANRLPNLRGAVHQERPKVESKLTNLVNIPETSFMAKLKRPGN